MELSALRRTLRGHAVPVAPGAGGPDEAARWLAAVEAGLGADPSPGARALLLAAEDHAAVWAEPLPDLPFRRDGLVRFDTWTATWVGTDPAAAAPCLVRTLRPHAVRRPVLVRAFRAEAQALQRVLAVSVGDGWSRLSLAGWPAEPVTGDALTRALGWAFADLERWKAAGLVPPAPGPLELRADASGRVRLATLGLGARWDDALAALLDRLDLRDDAPASAAWLPRPASLEEAARRWQAAAASGLTERRHALAARWRAGRQSSRRARLRDLVGRLDAAVPPPAGVGAVGVDLDGRITVVRGAAGVVTFGPDGAAEVAWDRVDGIRPALVRRLLRARALSPPNPVLDAQVGGDPARTEALCRWLAEAHRLRTVRMLLGVPG